MCHFLQLQPVKHQYFILPITKWATCWTHLLTRLLFHLQKLQPRCRGHQPHPKRKERPWWFKSRLTPPTLRSRPPGGQWFCSDCPGRRSAQDSKGEGAGPSATGDLSCYLSSPKSVSPRPGSQKNGSRRPDAHWARTLIRCSRSRLLSMALEKPLAAGGAGVCGLPGLRACSCDNSVVPDASGSAGDWMGTAPRSPTTSFAPRASPSPSPRPPAQPRPSTGRPGRLCAPRRPPSQAGPAVAAARAVTLDRSRYMLPPQSRLPPSLLRLGPRRAGRGGGAEAGLYSTSQSRPGGWATSASSAWSSSPF
jgi:hypothetical protein